MSKVGFTYNTKIDKFSGGVVWDIYTKSFYAVDNGFYYTSWASYDKYPSSDIYNNGETKIFQNIFDGKLYRFSNGKLVSISSGQGDGVMYIDITSSRGNIVINGQGSVTLTASVYQDGNDITATITPNRYSWTRDSGESASDATWNSTHIGVGNVITVTAEEVFRMASFFCKISD